MLPVLVACSILPQAVLKEKDKEQQNTTDESTYCQAHKASCQLVFELTDARLVYPAFVATMAPAEETRLADARTVKLLLEEVDPVFNIGEVGLRTQLQGEPVKIGSSRHACGSAHGVRWILYLLDAAGVRIVRLHRGKVCEDKLSSSTEIIHQICLAHSEPVLLPPRLARAIPRAHLLVCQQALIYVKADLQFPIAYA